jgi:hypothetical protein
MTCWRNCRERSQKILTCLKSLLRDAKRQENVAQNVAADVSIGPDNRTKQKLRVGVDIPAPDDIRRILHAAAGEARPF